jgi:hypothetical protein
LCGNNVDWFSASSWKYELTSFPFSCLILPDIPTLVAYWFLKKHDNDGWMNRNRNGRKGAGGGGRRGVDRRAGERERKRERGIG